MQFTHNSAQKHAASSRARRRFKHVDQRAAGVESGCGPVECHRCLTHLYMASRPCSSKAWRSQSKEGAMTYSLVAVKSKFAHPSPRDGKGPTAVTSVTTHVLCTPVDVTTHAYHRCESREASKNPHEFIQFISDRKNPGAAKG